MKSKYVIGIDPGYATQGICVLNTRTRKVEHFLTTQTGSSMGIVERIEWQMGQIIEVLRLLGQFGGVSLDALLVVEEYNASKSSHASPVSIYNRGMYDAMFRERLGWRFRHAITMHAQHVIQWSCHQRSKGQKFTAQEILDYVCKTSTWLNETPDEVSLKFVIKSLRGRNSDGKLDSVQGRKAGIMHATDALAMAQAGFVGCLHPEYGRGRSVAQYGWITKIRDLYNFDQEEKPHR